MVQSDLLNVRPRGADLREGYLWFSRTYLTYVHVAQISEKVRFRGSYGGKRREKLERYQVTNLHRDKLTS